MAIDSKRDPALSFRECCTETPPPPEKSPPVIEHRLIPFGIRAFSFLAAAAVAGCSGAKGPKPDREISEYRQLSAAEAPALQLQKVDSVILGGPETGVFSIIDMQVHDGDYYIVDEMAKAVHVFDSKGRHLRRLGGEGKGPGEFQTPMAVGFHEDGVLVLDPSIARPLSVFGFDGAFVENRPLDTPNAAVDFVVAGNRIAAMGGLAIPDPGKQGWNALGVFDMQGKRIGSGCIADPRYVESRRRDGRIARFEWGTVSERDGWIYCTQGISPVVQVMDSLGRPVEQIRTAPPFYAPPVDGEPTMDRKHIFEFLGSFTAMREIYPVDGGHVAVFSRFDPAKNSLRYHLFVCETGRDQRCGVVQDLPQPVYVPSLDTVYLQEDAEPDQPLEIGIYRISRPRART